MPVSPGPHSQKNPSDKSFMQRLPLPSHGLLSHGFSMTSLQSIPENPSPHKQRCAPFSKFTHVDPFLQRVGSSQGRGMGIEQFLEVNPA